jgi:hypothetical protein
MDVIFCHGNSDDLFYFYVLMRNDFISQRLPLPAPALSANIPEQATKERQRRSRMVMI